MRLNYFCNKCHKRRIASKVVVATKWCSLATQGNPFSVLGTEQGAATQTSKKKKKLNCSELEAELFNISQLCGNGTVPIIILAIWL